MTHAVEHLTVDERVAAGKTAREAVPREAHAAWEPAADRPDPVALLEQQAATRVPDLVPIRYGRMLATPFTFYRGAALIMASDLAGTPASGLQTQLCGDAHLTNFGLFASPGRRLLFDLNDFDETLPGPWEWDVKRLAASMAVAGRWLGFSRKRRRRVVEATAGGYRRAMRRFAGMRNLDVFYARVEADSLGQVLAAEMTETMRSRLAATVAKAHTSDSVKAFRRLTRVVDGEPRIVADPPLIVPLSEMVTAEEAGPFRDAIRDALRSYRRTLLPDRRAALEGFRLVDIAHKVVGVGSVGTRAWILLLLGRDGSDPLFLQFKQAEASVLEAFLGSARTRNHGARIVNGQRMMQAETDIFLGSTRVVRPDDGSERDFYARQLKDWKGSFDPEGATPEGLGVYGQVCGWTLARAHARSGDRVAIAAYLGGGTAFDRAIVQFAETYADQNERDHAALADAARTGRVTATTGV